MHDFHYRKNTLYCEGVRLETIARTVPTPFYVYSVKTLTDHYRKLARALAELDPLICFSVKANSNLAVLKTLIDAGAGLDVVSGGELFRARAAGARGERIVFAGVGKTDREISEAIGAGILLFNVESEPELEAIDRIARRMRKRVTVALRINPDVDPHTHRYITTGKKHTKFGLTFGAAGALWARRGRFSYARITGVHFHIGSQITSAAPFVAAIRKVLAFVDKNRMDLEFFNIGGGMGVVYSMERPQSAHAFGRAIVPLLAGRPFRVILEPGRFIAGTAGVLVCAVIYVKKSAGKTFVIVNAGMNDLIRPSLYDAFHRIVPLTRRAKNGSAVYDVVGPICESGDFLATARRMPVVRRGDRLAVMGAGAYGFTMSSNYNSRPRAAEVLVQGKSARIVRAPERYHDLIRNESLPEKTI